MTSFHREPPAAPGATGSPRTGSPRTDGPAGRYAEMKDEITAIKATATSADRAVSVVAGPGGAVLDVKVSDHALQGSAHSLNAAIMSTLRLAVADAARQQAAIVQRHAGGRLNILDRVMATQKEILGDRIEAGEQEEQRLAAQRGRPAGADDGSVFADGDPRVAPQWPAPPPPAPAPAPAHVGRRPAAPPPVEEDAYDVAGAIKEANDW